MDKYKYYEVVMAQQTDNEPNMLVVCVKSTAQPTKKDMEDFFTTKIKEYECDHVDSILEIDAKSAHENFYIETEEDFIIYK